MELHRIEHVLAEPESGFTVVLAYAGIVLVILSRESSLFPVLLCILLALGSLPSGRRHRGAIQTQTQTRDRHGSITAFCLYETRKGDKKRGWRVNLDWRLHSRRCGAAALVAVHGTTPKMALEACN